MYSAALLLVTMLVTVVAFGCEDSCNALTHSSIVGTNVNHSYSGVWNVTKFSNGAASPDCRNVTTEADGQWSSSCSWGVSCAAHNNSLILRELTLTVFEGDMAIIKSFSIENLFVSTSPLISLRDKFIPESTSSSRTFSFTPNVLVTGEAVQDIKVQLSLTSPNPASNAVYRVGVFMNFTCSRIYRYEVMDASLPMDTTTGFWSILCAYIIPGVILAVIIILALLRKFAPSLVLKVKGWIGLSDSEGGAKLRHAKIKDRAGGGTWHDHAKEIVSDLKEQKIHESRADNDEELDSDPEEMQKEKDFSSSSSDEKTKSDEQSTESSISLTDSDDSAESDFESDENSDPLL